LMLEALAFFIISSARAAGIRRGSCHERSASLAAAG